MVLSVKTDKTKLLRGGPDGEGPSVRRPGVLYSILATGEAHHGWPRIGRRSELSAVSFQEVKPPNVLRILVDRLVETGA